MREQAWKWAAGTVLLLALAGGALWLLRGGEHAAPPQQLVFAAHTGYVGSCPVVAAQHKGYFEAQGLEVTILKASSGKESLQAVLDGRADVATAADIPIVLAVMEGKPVQVMGTVYRSATDHGIVGRRDHGVVNPASLKGKKIGVTQGTSGHFTLDVFLNTARLQGGDVTMVNYKPEELGQALQRGDVDAIASWEPYLQNSLKVLGENGVGFSGEQAYETIYNVVALPRFINGHEGAIRRLLQALADGAAFCGSHPEGIHKVLPATAQMTQAELMAAWRGYHFSMDLDQSLLLALEDRARWVIRNRMGPGKEMPNFLDNVYLRGLDEVRPAAVSIIH
jgi:NitT/TauT family transport system substrate-binding protein